MAVRLRVLSGQIPGRKGREQNALENLVHIPHALQGQGARAKASKVGVGWGGVVQASCQHSHLFPGPTGGKSTSGFSAKAFPLWENSSFVTPPTPAPTPLPRSPQLRQTTTGKLCLGNIWLRT